jgi:hypothetical protein
MLTLLALSFGALRDARPLFEGDRWSCAEAPLKHVEKSLCDRPEIIRSAEKNYPVAIECATLGCSAWATNARDVREPEGLIRVHAAGAVWTSDVSEGDGVLHYSRFPWRLEDASAWFGVSRGTVLALRVVSNGNALTYCKALFEDTYIIRRDGGEWREVAHGVTGLFAPRLPQAEVDEGYATCPVRSREETHQCVFESDRHEKSTAVMRCGRHSQRIALSGASVELSALRPTLRKWWDRQGR